MTFDELSDEMKRWLESDATLARQFIAKLEHQPGFLTHRNEVLAEYARAHPQKQILVLCGHSHGASVCRPELNLEVRTGGWPPGIEGYGNPIVQATLEL